MTKPKTYKIKLTDLWKLEQKNGVNHLEVLAEIGLMLALPTMHQQLRSKSRLEFLYNRLTDNCKKLLMYLPTPDDDAKQLIKHRIMKWALEMKWEHGEVDMAALLSFLLVLVERSPYKYPGNIITGLNMIYDHLCEHRDVTEYLKEADNAIICWDTQGPLCLPSLS